MADELPENVRVEYAALIDYHNSIVTHRFTLAGLFAAAVALIDNTAIARIKWQLSKSYCCALGGCRAYRRPYA